MGGVGRGEWGWWGKWAKWGEWGEWGKWGKGQGGRVGPVGGVSAFANYRCSKIPPFLDRRQQRMAGFVGRRTREMQVT